MKSLLTITFTFLTLSCFAQTQKSGDAFYDLTLAYKPATVEILTDTGSLNSSFINNVERITYVDIIPGYYKVRISGQGQLTVIKDSIIVKEGQKLILNFKVDGPCLYDHPSDYIPTCPQNHKDSIIPIVYGLIITKGDTFIKNKTDMKVKYAGCVTTGCDPRFIAKNTILSSDKNDCLHCIGNMAGRRIYSQFFLLISFGFGRRITPSIRINNELLYL